MKAIFDIGANDGFNGLVFAILNLDTTVFSFEPNPQLEKMILKNKKIFENKLKINLKNFLLIKKAASNKKKKTFFYITKNHATSSLLKPKKIINKYWTKNKDFSINRIVEWIKIKKKIKIETIKLKDFCEKKKINIISYIHCDTQGHDLKVFEGLGNFRNIIQKGVLESAIKSELSLYKNAATLNDLKKKFKKWGYKINFIDEFHKNNPERNVYFSNLKFKNKIKVNLPNERELRLFKRILNKKTKIKDYISIFFLGKKF
jgi:FkbM family methyltransferase